MKSWHKTIALWSGAALSSCLLFTHAAAQHYPAKLVRILVGSAAGSGTDSAARMVAQKLTESLGQPVVVENRPGAGGMIATQAIVKSAPDGYTLLMSSSTDSIQPAMRAKMPYDYPRDFSPISFVATGPFIMVVHPSVPAKSVRELIAIARLRPGELNYASSGIGTSAHLAGELFNSLAKVKTTAVFYKGTPYAVVAAASGEVDFAYPSITGARPLIDGGRLRALAVTPAKRTALMPDMPTLYESGVPGYDRTSWMGLLGPAGMPKDVLTKLNSAIDKALNTPEMKAAFFKQGLELETSTPEQFTERMRREVEQNIKLARAAGIKPE